MMFGKIIAGGLGFMLGGPIMCLMGIAVGHMFDAGLSKTFAMNGFIPPAGAATQEAVFDAVFTIMGSLAKADGRVSKDEIALAEQLMGQMKLSPERRKMAIEEFKRGSVAGFDYKPVLETLDKAIPNRSPLREVVLTLLISLAFADNEFHDNERIVLLDVADMLGFSKQQFEHLLSMVHAQSHFGSEQSHEDQLKDAYEALGVEASQSNPEIKKAYRKLMSQHHPDKLIAQGMPEDMIKIATEQSQQIQGAYELIKKSR